MKLTPLDIRKQEFKRTMRGFDPDEVEAFLLMVADELELYIRERNRQNDELIKLRTQLRDYQRVESTLRETLVKAQNNVEDSRANSRREAEILIHEAELQAEEIVKESREELLSIRHEISLLKSQKDAMVKRLRHLLNSQVEMLDVMEDDNLDSEDTSGYGYSRPQRREQGGQNSGSTQTRPNPQSSQRPKIIREQPASGSEKQRNSGEPKKPAPGSEMHFNPRSKGFDSNS